MQGEQSDQEEVGAEACMDSLNKAEQSSLEKGEVSNEDEEKRDNILVKVID
jgi:hypothetical protein